MLPTFKNPFISLPNMHRCIKLCKRVFLISPFIRCFVRHRCAESFCPQPRLWEGGQRQATDGCFNPVGASPKPFLKISWRKCPYNKTKPRIITQRTKSSLCMLPWCAEESQTHLTKLNITPEWHGDIGTYKHVRLIRKPVMLHFLKHEDWHPKLKHLRGKSDRSQTPCAEELCSYWSAATLHLHVHSICSWLLTKLQSGDYAGRGKPFGMWCRITNPQFADTGKRERARSHHCCSCIPWRPLRTECWNLGYSGYSLIGIKYTSTYNTFQKKMHECIKVGYLG